MSEPEALPSHHAWPVTLRWGPLVLRPTRRSDEKTWAAVRRNTAWFGPWDATSPHGEPPITFSQSLRRQRRAGRAGTSVPWAITWDEGWPDAPSPPSRTRFIGGITIANIVRGAGQFASIGYWIDEAYAGRGIVPAAVSLAADYAWQVMGLHRIEIGYRPENTKSAAVVRKLGMRYEGMRPAFLHIDGAWRDHEIHVLNAEDVPEGLVARWRRTHPNGPGTPAVPASDGHDTPTS